MPVATILFARLTMKNKGFFFSLFDFVPEVNSSVGSVLLVSACGVSEVPLPNLITFWEMLDMISES